MQSKLHKPIIINNLTLNFGTKECISQRFTNNIYAGERIGIIGRNGSGKSSLIKLLYSFSIAYEGEINIPDDIISSYIPQLIIDEKSQCSGGQLFNKYLSEAIANEPNLLLLDEPTNHLDLHNRRALLGLLKRYKGTLVVVTHDLELLNYVDTIWHVNNGRVTTFNGKYSDYKKEQADEWNNLTGNIKLLNNQKKLLHDRLMQEQKRAKNSRNQGEKNIQQRKWPTITSVAKARRAEMTSGKNQNNIVQNKQAIMAQLEKLYMPEIIVPKFSLSSNGINSAKNIVNIVDGTISYSNNETIVKNINLQIQATEKIAILGNNGSGKSTLIKAIMSKHNITKSGEWNTLAIDEIGYVDQHYTSLDSDSTATELIQGSVPDWSYAEIRNHLNMFLLRKNEEVNIKVRYLSGGEKVRLNLALIAAKPPKLLILDEITNNIDLETKEHLIQVLSNYHGSMILICHELNFIQSLNIDSHYIIENKELYYKKTDNIFCGTLFEKL